MSSDPAAPMASPKLMAPAPSTALAAAPDPVHSSENPAAPNGPPVVNVANGLTVLRLALVPAFIVVLLHGHGMLAPWRAGAAAIFLLAAVTDHYDGHLARRRGLITNFGKLADPIADKALVGAALICLSYFGQLSWWVTGIILGREVAVTAIRFAVKKHKVIAASWAGKAKTVLQISAITGYLLCPQVIDWDWLSTVVLLTMVLAVAATVATGVDYALTAWSVVRAEKPTTPRGAETAADGVVERTVGSPVGTKVNPVASPSQGEATAAVAPAVAGNAGGADAAVARPVRAVSSTVNAAGAVNEVPAQPAKPARPRPRVPFKPVPSASAAKKTIEPSPAPEPGTTPAPKSAAKRKPARAPRPEPAVASKSAPAPAPRPAPSAIQPSTPGPATPGAPPLAAQPVSEPKRSPAAQPPPPSEAVKPTRPVEGWPDAGAKPARPPAKPIPTAPGGIRTPEWTQLRTVRQAEGADQTTQPSVPKSPSSPTPAPIPARRVSTGGSFAPTTRARSEPAVQQVPRPRPTTADTVRSAVPTASAVPKLPTPNRSGGAEQTGPPVSTLDAAQAAAEARMAEIKRRIGWTTTTGGAGEE
ncbi:MAG: CDP-diacylglycerol--glycerol-3-phosphate 3-phosphatidyltransferase [Bifidobacteriaceae bacterium]|nr:CDP-diacylglycerol--glycerol-3-phosphate 3-phosphatidyltransferase [Bifidobacteriaceae bacterium]